MSDDAGLAGWFRLTSTPGIGATTLRKLLQQFGLPDRILATRRSELANFLAPDALSALDSPDVAKSVERALRWVAEPGNHAVTLADDCYPKALLEISDPPALLYCRGQTRLLGRPALAMVGSRNGTASGVRNAESFASTLSHAGLTIVSGLALGIDAAVHRGGLAGIGSTIAVLGTGIDICYPARNIELARKIGELGLLLSEFPLGTRAIAGNFPRRNRLISGLSQGCVVVEAALASGSLITARSALDQGREVFAIPGSIHSPLSKGCHALIKSGAKLVESAEDILAELPGVPEKMKSLQLPAVEQGGTSAEPVLDLMGFDPIDIDTLSHRAGLSTEKISGKLLQLELEGLIGKLPGG
ncbi:MAG: DNA-processing protein DprA, partial [Betaproteobacteria bacterium]|nr:DNA-processing protein DprA [Betaproteobacteria bacterium]